MARVFASMRVAELTHSRWSAEQRAEFVCSQSDFQRAAYAARYPDSGFEVVLVDGTPAGRVFVARAETELRIVDIVLLDGFRGSGIGSQVLQGVLDEAAARGVGVVLEVDLGSPARRLYERLGFAVEASGDLQVSMRWTPGG